MKFFVVCSLAEGRREYLTHFHLIFFRIAVISSLESWKDTDLDKSLLNIDLGFETELSLLNF